MAKDSKAEVHAGAVSIPGRLEAVCVIKGDSEMLFRSYQLTLVDGVLTEWSELTRADDLPTIAVGLAQKTLWTQSKRNSGVRL